MSYNTLPVCGSSLGRPGPGVPKGYLIRYEFLGWDTALARVTNNATYTTLVKPYYDGKVRGRSDEPDLMVKFGVKEAGYSLSDITPTDVTDAFEQVSAYLRDLSSQNDLSTSDIRLEDYIDLYSLRVAPFPGPHQLYDSDVGTGAQSGLVGIPKYQNVVTGVPGSEKAHLVFQFQNLLTVVPTGFPQALVGWDRYQNVTFRRFLVQTPDYNGNNGYMAKYEGPFLKGLAASGVPEERI
jgi:hypothetical protein